jgi:hypothetical protein
MATFEIMTIVVLAIATRFKNILFWIREGICELGIKKENSKKSFY